MPGWIAADHPTSEDDKRIILSHNPRGWVSTIEHRAAYGCTFHVLSGKLIFDKTRCFFLLRVGYGVPLSPVWMLQEGSLQIADNRIVLVFCSIP